MRPRRRSTTRKPISSANSISLILAPRRGPRSMLRYATFRPRRPILRVWSGRPRRRSPSSGAIRICRAIITPATGWLEARFGRKPLFLTAVIGFVVTSMLCGAAVSLAQMVVFRLLQGIFGAPLVPLSQSVLLDAYPQEQQGQAMAVFGLGVMLGPILGPTLGGWLTDSYSWRWVFYVNVPFGVLCALGLLLFLGRRTDRPPARRLDWFGFSTLGLGIG